MNCISFEYLKFDNYDQFKYFSIHLQMLNIVISMIILEFTEMGVGLSNHIYQMPLYCLSRIKYKSSYY